MALFVLVKKPDARTRKDAYYENNIVSETLIAARWQQDYKVVDVVPTGRAETAKIETGFKHGKLLRLRPLLYIYLSNILIIREIDYSVSTNEGDDIGYGVSMPFNHVLVRLNYRAAARNTKTGRIQVLSAGTESGKGLASSVEYATAQGVRDLA